MNEGLSLRFIRQYKSDDETRFQWAMFDQAILLASHDERDIPFPIKVADALTFLKSRVH